MKKHKGIIIGVSAVIVLFSSLLVLGSCSKFDNAKNKLGLKDNAKSYIGTYRTTDALGLDMTIKIKEGNKIELIAGHSGNSNRETYYGTWEESYGGYIYITMNERPKVYTAIDEDGYYSLLYIKDGYMYLDGTDCEAENPKKRLKLN